MQEIVYGESLIALDYLLVDQFSLASRNNPLNDHCVDSLNRPSHGDSHGTLIDWAGHLST